MLYTCSILPAPVCGMTRCQYLHNTHHAILQTDAYAAIGFWYQVMARPGAYAALLAPANRSCYVSVLIALSRLGRGQQYQRLQQQLVLLASTCGPFSSSGCLKER